MYSMNHHPDKLKARVKAARALLADCSACPRGCSVDRQLDQPGVCATGHEAMVSSAFVHMGEEPCLVGRRGSGTIFFSRCNLHCVFCQNHDISQNSQGERCTPEQIAELAIGLQECGCHNVNFVTPQHVVPQTVEAIVLAVEKGLRVPVVYNTNAYDGCESLRLLEGLVDIYMPDFKFWTNESAARYCGAADYPERARAALHEMHRQVGSLILDDDGLAVRGLLVRHLVMPTLGQESVAILRWLAEELSPDTWVNIMDQYRPCHLVGAMEDDGTVRYPELNRRPTRSELARVVGAAREAGLWRLEGWD